MKLLLLGLLFFCPLCALRVGFLPFADLSSYKGNWVLMKDVPVYTGAFLKQTCSVVPFDSIRAFIKKNNLAPASLNTPSVIHGLARAFNADFLFDGEIQNFAVRKIIMGEGKYGGVKNYRADIKAKIRVYALRENGFIYSSEPEVTKKENLTAVNLGKLSDDEALFDTLNQVPFGSPPFEKSVAGSMMREFCEKLAIILLGLPKPPDRPIARKTVKEAKIVDLRGEDVYLNAGLDDQVEIGDVFNVFAKGDSLRDPDDGSFLGMSERLIGTVQISFVEAAHFSRAKIIEKKEPFKLKDIVRIEK